MFAKNIRYLRKRAEMSQDKLAEMLGYKSFTTIQKWESGVSEPSMATAQKIANLFHVDIDDLIKTDLEAGKPKDEHYINEETAQIGANPEALQAAQAMLKVLKRKERGS